MKKISILLFILLPFIGFAQTPTNGDYRTAKVIGNWSDVDMWETRLAGLWIATATAPTSANNVYIQNGDAVTVDVATASCKDLHFNIAGSLIVDVNTVEISGKLRAYNGTAVTGAGADGTFYSGQASATSGYGALMGTATGAGTLKVIGSSRTVFNTGEWTGSQFSTCPIVFNLTSGQTAICVPSIKFKNVTVENGTTVDAASTARIGADDGLGTGNVTIKTGGKIISARSGTGSQVFSAQSATKCGTVTIETGGILELTGATPAIDATTIVNNGTVTFSRAGTQTLLQKGVDAGSANIPGYNTLVLSNTSTKTPAVAFSVSNLLVFNGTATLAATALLPITMLNGSTVERTVTSGTSLPSTAGAVFYGTVPSDFVNVTIGSTIASSNEFIAAPTPGKIGTLTINSGATYTLTGSRNCTDFVYNGILNLNPGSTMTMTIEGNASGTGTIDGHTGATVAFTSMANGATGILRYATNLTANNITINMPGVGAAVTMASAVTLSGNLSLTAGTINDNGNIITVPGNISGSGTHTSSPGGKIVLTGPTATISSSSTLGNVESTNANGVLVTSSPTIIGTLTLTAGNLTLMPTTTSTLTIEGSIAGAGTVTGHAGSSITFTGAKPGSAGTINFTGGSQIANNFKVDLTDPGASVTLGTPVVLFGNLNLTTGTLNAGSNLITVPGNITGSGSYTGSLGGKVLLTANPGVATISSANLYSLELDNANGFALTGSPSVSGVLTMTNGVLTIPATRIFTITSGNNINGFPFSISKYVICENSGTSVGSLQINNIVGPKSFPVGSPTKYLPVSLNTSATSMDYLVNVFEGVTQNGAPDGTPATAIQKQTLVDAIWTINRLNGTGNCIVTLNWQTSLEGSTFSGLLNADIGMGRYNGTNFGTLSGTGDNTINTVTETYNTFSPFIVGQKGFLVLPVTLKSLSATVKSAGTELVWDVANEQSIDRYVVEKSINGYDFNIIGHVLAVNKENYSFTDGAIINSLVYYRIKMLSKTGDIKYSNVVMVKPNGKTDITLYPNPVVKSLILSGLPPIANINIINTVGQSMIQQKSNANSLTVDVSKLPKGLYFIQITAEDKILAKQSFIKL